MVNVKEFRGEFRFLSNFWPSPVAGPGNLVYPTVEHAYQASKTKWEYQWKHILTCDTAGEAKKFGKELDGQRANWPDIKIQIMYNLVWMKFYQYDNLAEKLLKIDGTISEGNTWGDTFWGVDLKTGKGDNNLGKILMEVRDKLK